ncbi:hypothetical protein M422DRAFT_122480, partial [Sphaerobolus stellatus SS14]
AKAFAAATGQEFHFYYSEDSYGKGKKKKKLQNMAAEAAWNARVKDAGDMGGRLPLLPGMPCFLTENIATELGLSNGSEGTVVSVKYKIVDGKRYAVAVNVDFKSYNNPKKVYPHRVTLV